MELTRKWPVSSRSGGVPSLRRPTGEGPRERGILFSAPMVRALLDGRKTQTRRIIKYDGDLIVGDLLGQPKWYLNADPMRVIRCPYGVPGDRLWVRETHAQFAVGDCSGTAPQCVAYRATCAPDGSFDYVNNGDEVLNLKVTKWTPGIHMPRWASRITLKVTEVRVQRVQDISEDDARAEGVYHASSGGYLPWKPDGGATLSCREARAAFEWLWREINGADSWSANPWVWAVSFKVVTP